MMDWTSGKGLDLLKRAYPSRFLPRRGVLCLEGWTVDATDSFATFSLGFDSPTFTIDLAKMKIAEVYRIDRQHASKIWRRGDLLPKPDVRDRATWACMLDDLAQTLGWKEYANLGWWKMRPGYWHIHGCPTSEIEQEEGDFCSVSFTIEDDTVGPEEALLRLKIRLGGEPTTRGMLEE